MSFFTDFHLDRIIWITNFWLPTNNIIQQIWETLIQHIVWGYNVGKTYLTEIYSSFGSIRQCGFSYFWTFCFFYHTVEINNNFSVKCGFLNKPRECNQRSFYSKIISKILQTGIRYKFFIKNLKKIPIKNMNKIW